MEDKIFRIDENVYTKYILRETHYNELFQRIIVKVQYIICNMYFDNYNFELIKNLIEKTIN